MSREFPNRLRFIADVMLGRLARWLRLLGFDTRYYHCIGDADLLREALREDRLLLTRDTHFSKIKNLKNFLLIKSDDPVEQVREVLLSLGIREFGPARCASCNGTLDIVAQKELVRNRVPEYIFFGSAGFSRCKECDRIYWEGTHLKRFREMLYTLFRKE